MNLIHIQLIYIKFNFLNIIKNNIKTVSYTHPDAADDIL
jgi:hypothetical protein